MKQPERVAELLAELRALTENDFERHRIDVLEKDLHEPPTVEIIDDTHQRFNGVTYLSKKTNEHFSQTIGLHRFVWQYYYGEIPGGYIIHHIDHNKANNNIANLQMVTAHEHQQLHRKYDREKICPVCGKNFVATHHNRVCCSKECGHISAGQKSSATQLAKSTLTEKICPQCGKKFKPTNYRIKYCCRQCFYQAGWKKNIEKTCAYCGKSFVADRPQRIFCSKSCAAKSRCQIVTPLAKS